MSIFGIWELVLLLFLGLVSVPMPLSVPPLPEDQNLLRAAPAESIAYFSWFGRAKANPKSANLTERLSAEPQIRNFAIQMAKALRGAWELEAREHAELAGECFNALALMVERPGCVFVSGVDLPPKEPSIRGGLVVNLGMSGALVKPTLKKLETWIVEESRAEGGVRPFEPIPGVKFRGLPMPNDAPEFSWGFVDGYLVLALGEGMAKKIAAGLRGADGAKGMTGHAFFKEVQAKIRVARPCFRTFIDLEQVIEKAGRAGGRDVAQILSALGLEDLQAILSETGLEGDGFVARSMLATKGKSGVLSLIDGPPLASKELAVIPGDATLASAFRADPHRLYKQLLELIGKVDPRMPGQVESEIVRAVQAATGLDLEKDLLAHMGDSVAIWNSPGQGGLLFTGLTVALEIDDAPAFKKSFAEVMGSLKEMMPPKQRSASGRLRRGVYIESMQAKGAGKIWFLNTVGDEMPFAPAWCVTDKHLMVSLFPQMLKASLARGRDLETSLANHPKVRVMQDAVAISYFDAPRLFTSLYPALHLLGQFAASELQREGFEIHIGMLPTAGSIQPHLTTETSRLAVRADGLLLTRRGSIPIVDPVLGSVAPILGVVPFVLMQDRAMRAMMQRDAAERARAAEVERQKKLEAERKAEAKRKKADRKDKAPL